MDEVGKIIIILISIIVFTIGTILIYDARNIAKKIFGGQDQNNATVAMKILGVIFFIIGTLIYLI